MKREILFKGKLSHSKTWIDGNLIIAKNGSTYIIPSDVFEPDGHHLIIDSDSPFWVDDDSMCQYVNHKTKEGKKIFEGDYDEDYNVLFWCDKCKSFEFGCLDVPTKEIVFCNACEGHFMFSEHIDEFEPIGNLHDIVN